MTQTDGNKSLFGASDEITALVPASRPRGFVRVRVGRKTVAVLHPREAEILDLKPGRMIDERLRAQLGAAQARSSVRRDAERLLSRRALTESELHERLIAQGPDALAVAEVVAALRRAGALDDARVVASAAANALGRRRAAGAAVSDLEARGVEARVAKQAVGAAAADRRESDWDRALALAQARIRGQLAAADPRTQRRRLAGVLARRGYEDDLIERILDAVLPPLPPPAEHAG